MNLIMAGVIFLFALICFVGCNVLAMWLGFGLVIVNGFWLLFYLALGAVSTLFLLVIVFSLLQKELAAYNKEEK